MQNCVCDAVLGTAESRGKGRGVARERLDLGKDGVLFNVQPVSKWSTIFLKRGGKKERWGWQSAFLRMKGGTARENSS